MTTAVLTNHLTWKWTSFADTALDRVARLWYATTVLGQLLFVTAVASFYASALVRGDLSAWNRFMTHGYVKGDTVGNVAVAVHLLAAVLIIVSGAIQLLPQVRHRAPALHRWNGRVYVATALTTSVAALYMSWFRGSPGDVSQKLGTSLNAALIIAFAIMALRTAMRRDFQTHRVWALSLFLAVSGVWFFRIGFALSLLVNKGPWGFDPKTFRGPFLTFLSFASYLIPLAVLQLYLRAQARPRGPGRLVMAGGLLALTLAMAAGIFAATLVFWAPAIQAAFDGRKSIAGTVSETISSRGIDAAVAQYRDLKASRPDAYDFSERELSVLGRELIAANRFGEGIRLLQLNAESYPKSSRAQERLGDAYLGHGDRSPAIASYRRSLLLDPGNRAVAEALQKLDATRQ